MHHQWELQASDPGVRSGVRTYVCLKCGAAVTVLDSSGKRGIRKAARNMRIDMDCSLYRVRSVMES